MKTLLAGGTVVNVFTGELEHANVLLDGPVIAGVGDYTADEADAVEDVTGKVICPGFIDGHMHIESTMLLPAELARVSVPPGTTALVDYGAGNLTSVRNAFAALGVETTATRDPAVVAAADRVVFPGVGAAKSAMENLRELGLEAAVREAAASGKPFLGICLGMQILFAHTEEDGGVDTLGILPGQVRLFPDVPGFKVPEIGWNQVRIKDGGAKDGLE